MMRRARVALAALLALCLLLSAPALAQETLWWLHGDFDSVETDGYSLSGSVLEYQKIAYAGEISLYAAGYPAGSGVALLTPEESGGDLAYERMEAVSLGQTQAERWRYEDAGSRWDFLAVETGDFLMSVMIALPAEDAENLNAEVEALIASLSLESAAQDAAPMLTADLDGFVTLMDRIDGEGRMLACTLGDGSAVSATFLRGAADEADFASMEVMRQAFVLAEGDAAEQLESVQISGETAERWRFTFTMEDGSDCRTDAVLLRTQTHGYAAIIGLTGEVSEEYEEVVERLVSSLALESEEG